MSFERLYLEMFITVSPPPGGGGKTAIALFQQRAPDIGLARPNETKQTRFIWSRETKRDQTGALGSGRRRTRARLGVDVRWRHWMRWVHLMHALKHWVHWVRALGALDAVDARIRCIGCSGRVHCTSWAHCLHWMHWAHLMDAFDTLDTLYDAFDACGTLDALLRSGAQTMATVLGT